MKLVIKINIKDIKFVDNNNIYIFQVNDLLKIDGNIDLEIKVKWCRENRIIAELKHVSLFYLVALLENNYKAEIIDPNIYLK